MRQMQITIPKDRAEQIVDILRKKSKIQNILQLEGNKDTFILVRMQETDVSDTVTYLQEVGVGIDYGIIDVIGLEATIPPLVLTEGKGKSKASSRLLTEEIYNDLVSGSLISPEYLVFIILAAFIAGFGLYSNSVTVVVASMLISPLMGPILGFTLGINVKDYKLSRHALFTEFLGLGFAIAVGCFLGLVFPKPVVLPIEMSIRGGWGYVEVIIAFISGIAVTYSITSGIQSALVGVAISASLMPPAVNVGMCLIFGYIDVALGSLTLFGINVLAINFSAFLIMWIKRINPLRPTSFDWIGPTPGRLGDEEKSWWQKIYIDTSKAK